MPRGGTASKVRLTVEFQAVTTPFPVRVLPRIAIAARTPTSYAAVGGNMAAFDEHKEELEHYEQMMGAWRGRLAVTLDRLTEAMVLVGQHGVYCHSARDPEKPTLDIET